MAHLAGEISLDEVSIQMRRQTRVFIRRQANWFKPDDPKIHWIAMQEGESAAAVSLILRWLAEILFHLLCTFRKHATI